ncbi:MAG TPA: DMT family transporter, partial [Roseiarcus sp.]|nr:DMT family transporter [Roseiarcus sp.]
MQGEAAARRRGLILVSIATALWSSAGLFARALDHLDVWTVLAGRGAFGALFMFCASIVEWRRGELGPRFGLGSKLAPLIVLFAAGAMTAYIAALRLTSVAEVMAIYATLPFVTAGLAFVLVGERIPTRTLAAAGLALVGVLVMVGGDVGAGRLAGQALSFGMTICFALMVVAQRRHREMSLTSINALGALVSAIIAFSLAPRERIEMPDLF